METITWIITGVAVTIFLTGVIATIVIKVDVIPKWKTISKILIWVIGLLIFRLVIWSLWNKNWSRTINTSPVQPVVANSEIQTVQMAEEWVFIWRKPPGHTSIGGNNSLELKVEITKNNQNSFWAVLHDTDGHGVDVSVAGLRLSKIGNDLIGEWTNYQDADGGKCYLYKTSDGWSGHYELKNGDRTDCRLEKRK